MLASSNGKTMDHMMGIAAPPILQANQRIGQTAASPPPRFASAARFDYGPDRRIWRCIAGTCP